MISVEELARRYCEVGHPVRRQGPIATCATHIILARGTYALLSPADQPQAAAVVGVLVDALEEANPRDPEQPGVVPGQTGLLETLEQGQPEVTSAGIVPHG